MLQPNASVSIGQIEKEYNTMQHIYILWHVVSHQMLVIHDLSERLCNIPDRFHIHSLESWDPEIG